MRAIAVVALVLAMSSTAFAGPQSTIGGKRLKSEVVHNTGVGWPSLFYEWWNKGQGNLDWALGAELVYGDWSGAFSDVSARFGIQRSAPLAHPRTGSTPRPRPTLGFGSRRVLWSAVAIVALRASRRSSARSTRHGGRARRARGSYFGRRARPGQRRYRSDDSVDPDVRKKTQDPWGIIPLLIRMGVEINAAPKVAPFFLFELGPAIGIGNGTSDVDFAFRVWVGTAFWSVLGK